MSVFGHDIRLTIDRDVQQFAEPALQTQLRLLRGVEAVANAQTASPVAYPAPAGALVAERSQTGEIVAMASYPTFEGCQIISRLRLLSSGGRR